MGRRKGERAKCIYCGRDFIRNYPDHLACGEPDCQKPEPSLKERAPYPWCIGNPTVEDCIRHGYCRRDPNCGN